MKHTLRAWIAVAAAAALPAFAPAFPAQAAPKPSASAPADADLSAAQKVSMAARQEKAQKDAAAINADTKLTPAQKQAKLLALSQAFDKDMLAILTPAQRAILLKQRGINAQFQQDVDALRTNTKLTDTQKQAQYQTLMVNRQNALLATLPPAQRAKLEQEHKAQLARVTEANKIGEALQKSLSKKVQDQIQQMTLDTRAKMQAVSTDTSLSAPAKSARIKALGDDLETRINALLTPAQRKQFAQFHALTAPPSTP